MNSKVSVTEVPQVIVEVPVIRLVLDLTQRDVNAIYEMTGVIEGPKDGTRKVFKDIRAALCSIAHGQARPTFITTDSQITFN